MSAKKIRYAVVGLGWITQEAVLPAFSHAKENSELAALISDDDVKLKDLGDRYGVGLRYHYKDYEKCLKSGAIDAVYIALPNAMHCEYTVRAAQAGIHILCEKPMAIEEKECVQMLQAAHQGKVKLMIAYRLHFEEGNLKAIEIARSGKLGDIRIFNSTFTMNVAEGNTRLDQDLAGGTLYDVGIYCINAARSIFRAEPEEVMALSSFGREERFKEVDEMTTAVLRFPQDRFASFTCSFATASTSAYDIIGTQGHLRVDPAYHHNGEVRHVLTINENKEEKTFGKRDQFAPEILYFSDCILKNHHPEPSGIEGWADVRVIQALYRSAEENAPVMLKSFDKQTHPSIKQSIKRPQVGKPKLIRAQRPQKNR